MSVFPMALSIAATHKITENANELLPRSVFKAIEERTLRSGPEPKRGQRTFRPIASFGEKSDHIGVDGFDLERALIRLLRGGRVSTQSVVPLSIFSLLLKRQWLTATQIVYKLPANL